MKTWTNEFGVVLSVDEGGREHRGKGPGGGQFVSKGSETNQDQLVSKHITDSKSLSRSEREELTKLVLNSKTKSKQLQRVSHTDGYHYEGDIIELGPTSFTSINLLSGEDAGNISVKYSDEVVYVIDKPLRGIDVDYKKSNANNYFYAGDEKETIAAGKYKVTSKKKEEHPGRSGDIVVYRLEEISTKSTSKPLSVDATGREHRGKGEGGGQFVKKSTDGADTQDEKSGNTKIKPGHIGEIRSRVLDAAEALKKRKTFFGLFSARPDDATKSGMVAERSKELKGYRSELARTLPDKETVERKKSGVRSVNEVYFDKKADGTRTIYKPEAKYSQAPSINYNHNVSEAAREVATFKLAEVIGATDLVPATAWTAGQAGDRTTGRATVQEFVPGVSGMKFTSGRASGITKLNKGMTKRALMLDLLTGNNDRHAGNWFVNGAEHIHLIDNGRAFPDRDDVYHYYDQGWYGVMINETVPEEVSEWYDKREAIDKVLEENGISKSARAGVQKRLEALNRAKGKKFGSVSFKTDDGRLLDYQLFYG